MERLVISLAGNDTYRLLATCAQQAIPWRSVRLLLCAVASIAYVAAGRIDLFTDTSLNLWDCAVGDLLLQEAGGPACVDFQGVPIFPEYVRRILDLEHTGGFSIMGASSPELLRNPLQKLIAATGLQA